MEPETSTWGAVSITTDPYATPMSDSAGPRDVIVHVATDSGRQALLSTITTTESQQDEITFHTTQTLKSPHLLAGSTIISQQKIHIIPHKNNRSGGHRKIFHSRRRIIKPSRISNVQSLLNQLKQSSSKKSTGTTEAPPTTEKPVQKTTLSYLNYDITSKNIYTQKESRPDVSDGHIASTYSTEFEPTPGQLLNKHKESIISTTVITSTTASKVIRGKIPWTRLFGNKNREKMLGRLKKPFIRRKLTTTTTAETKTARFTTTSPNVFTTHSMDKKDILPPSRNMEKKEGSSDDYEGLSSSDSESTTLQPSISQVTTTTESYYRSFTTDETTPGLQILPLPPTVEAPSAANEVVLSGSGGLPDVLPIIRQRPGWKGQKRKVFRGRKPLNRPANELHQSQVKPSTTGNKMETTTPHNWTYSHYKPSNKPADVNLYENIYWSSTNSTLAYIATKKPLIPSTTFNPTTTLRETTLRTKVYNTKPPNLSKTAQTRRPQVKGIKPMKSNKAQETKEKSLSPGTMMTLTLEQKHTGTPASYNVTDASFYDRANDIEMKSSGIQDFEVTTKLMANKPKITGGNAASYTILSHSNAYLPCDAVGNPQPTIKWRRLPYGTGMYAIIFVGI